MSVLRQKMIEDMQLRGLAVRTQESYMQAVRQLAGHYHKSPDQISEEEVRQYFLFLKNVKHVSRSTQTIALCGIKFFYEQTLKRTWHTLAFARPAREKKLPVVLSMQEVGRLLGCVHYLRYRVCLTTIYACGLRLQEGTYLQVKDIDGERKMLHIRQGKGGRDRYVPVPEAALLMLRDYWRTHHNRVWLFPSFHTAQAVDQAHKPMDVTGVQKAFRAALQESGVNKYATVHTLQHSYATHLMEAGVNLHVIQNYLGHSSPATTVIYTHLTSTIHACPTVALELADIFRQYGSAYRQKYADRILPSHRQAMLAIERCRSESLGGQVYACPSCGETRYSYHSCRNRHCPKCQHERTETWLDLQRELLLSVPYFMLTFTLPEELRSLARQNQKLFYHLLFQASAEATQQLAKDPRYVGGQIGLVGVLHTWTRNLAYHPHVHYLAPGGGLQENRWISSRADFFLPVKALSKLFRAHFQHLLRKSPLFAKISRKVWSQDWVVHCLPVGDGRAALKYLAPYIHRVALSNRRLVEIVHRGGMETSQVTFQYRTSDIGQLKRCTLSVEHFIQRFLQHVLPKGFVKIRYFGFLAPNRRTTLSLAQNLLSTEPTLPATDSQIETSASTPVSPNLLCPACGKPMQLLRSLAPSVCVAPHPAARSP